MRLNRQNLFLLYLILISWSRVFIRIHFRKPVRYLTVSKSDTSTSGNISEKEWAILRKVVRGTRRIRFLFHKSRRCLVESLIVQEVLKHFGIQSELHFGARKDQNTVQTHAWVTLGGKTVVGGPVGNYRKLIRIH